MCSAGALQPPASPENRSRHLRGACGTHEGPEYAGSRQGVGSHRGGRLIAAASEPLRSQASDHGTGSGKDTRVRCLWAPVGSAFPGSTG